MITGGVPNSEREKSQWKKKEKFKSNIKKKKTLPSLPLKQPNNQENKTKQTKPSNPKHNCKAKFS